MKVLNTYDFVSERMKFRPVTNAEWEHVRNDIKNHKNPFGLTEKDLIGEIKYFPMGVVVKMLEEQQNQGNTPDVTMFQKEATIGKNLKGFDWNNTKDGWTFWSNIIIDIQFSLFFEAYPEYKKYNIKKVTPNKYNITEKDLVGDIKYFPMGVVVRMLEEQEKQGLKTDVTVFQKDRTATAFNNGFDWKSSTINFNFWMEVIKYKKFMRFFKEYPEYLNTIYIKMKVLKTDNFISERMKFRPVTNAEWEQVRKDMENNVNPFGLTEKDLIGEIKCFPMGLVVRMLEEQQKQGNISDVTVFQRDRTSAKAEKGFGWDFTKDEWKFWNDVIENGNFSYFFETYPEYKKYNIRKTTPNKYNITEKDLVDDLKDFPVSVVVRMLEEQEDQVNKADVTVFQINRTATAFARGFNWKNTAAGHDFWDNVIKNKKFMMFFKRYPDYVKYNIY